MAERESQNLISQIKSSKVEQSFSDKYKEQWKRDLENSLIEAKKILERVKNTPLYEVFKKNYDNLIENIKQSLKNDRNISIKERNKIINEVREMLSLEKNTKKQEKKGRNLIEKGRNKYQEIKLGLEYWNDIIEKWYAKNYILLYSEDKGNHVIPMLNFQSQIKNNPIQSLNKRWLLSYFNFLKSRSQISRVSLIKEFWSEERANKFLDFLKREKNNNTYLNQVWWMVGKLFQEWMERQNKALNYLQKKWTNLTQEALIRVELASASWFWNNKLHIYSNKRWNEVIKISKFEIQIRWIKSIQELNAKWLYNYIQYLKSKWWFNDNFIQKFNNPIINKKNLSDFEKAYTKNKVNEFYNKFIENPIENTNNFIKQWWERHNQGINNTKEISDKTIKYIKNTVEWNFQEEKKKSTYQNSQKTEQENSKKEPPSKKNPSNIRKSQKNTNDNFIWQRIPINPKIIWPRQRFLEPIEWWQYNITSFDGKTIVPKITENEAEKIKENPEVAKNIIKFYKFFKPINLLSVWEYRNEIIHAIDKRWINKDDDFLNENEFLKFWDTIIDFINKSWRKLVPAWNIKQMRETLKSFSQANNFLSKKGTNERNEDKFTELLREKWVIKDGQPFNTIKFQEILNGQQKKS